MHEVKSIAQTHPHGICPVRGCTQPLPGRFSVLCAVHYFCVPQRDVAAVMRIKIKANYEKNERLKTAFIDQLPRQTAALARSIEERA